MSNSIIESAVNWAVGIANDNSHGYSQSTRWGPSYDCSSLVISAYQQAFAAAGKKGPKDFGATYTGNMRAAFKKCGFVEVDIGTRTRGDVLLNDTYHTAMMVNAQTLVHARSSEGTTDTADGSGNEIRCQSYFVYSKGWNCCLRYTGGSTSSTTSSTSATAGGTVTVTASSTTSGTSKASTAKVSTVLPTLRYGSTGSSVRKLQLLLNYHEAGLTVDGQFGSGTKAAVIKIQTACGIEADGIVGSQTWGALINKE